MENQGFQKMASSGSAGFLTTIQDNVSKNPLTATEIQEWIVSYLSQLLEIDPDEVDITVPFDQYGFDSSVAVGMTGDLEDWVGRKIDPTLLYDYPTIETLAQHLVEEFKTKE